MNPVEIKLQVVPAEEIDELQQRCRALEASNQAVLAQLEALRCRYSELLMVFKDFKKSL